MKCIPKFKNEAEEQEFWKNADSVDYIDWSKAKKTVLPNLKPSLKTISLRLPEIMLEELKLLANKRVVYSPAFSLLLLSFSSIFHLLLSSIYFILLPPTNYPEQPWSWHPVQSPVPF